MILLLGWHVPSVFDVPIALPKRNPRLPQMWQFLIYNNTPNEIFVFRRAKCYTDMESFASTQATQDTFTRRSSGWSHVSFPSW